MATTSPAVSASPAASSPAISAPPVISASVVSASPPAVSASPPAVSALPPAVTASPPISESPAVTASPPAVPALPAKVAAGMTTSSMSLADRKEMLEDAHLAALLKVKKASLSVAEIELAMARITATIDDYTTALKRAQACSQKSVAVTDSTESAFKSLQNELQVLACNLKVKKIEERIAKLNQKEHSNRLKSIRREEQCGSLNNYVAFLTERKKKSFGTAHKDGIGWKLYVPGMSTKQLDTTASEREPVIFPTDVPPALVELANIRTRSVTIFFALARLFPPSVAEEPMFRGGRLEMHVAGADWSEGRSVDQTAVVFLELLHLLRLHYGPRVSSVEIVLVGPHIDHSLAGKNVVLDNILNSKNTPRPLPSLTLQYSSGLYHDFARRRKPSCPGPPHMVLCFNAGIWGFEEWRETIMHIHSELRCPLLITSYNMHESFEDQETMQEWGATEQCWVWGPELNPFRSLQRRRSGATADNCYWQCVWMGASDIAVNKDANTEKFPLARGVPTLKARALEILETPTKTMKTTSKITTSNKITKEVTS